MAFGDLRAHPLSVSLLQRSLERGRLGHAYLFVGGQLSELEPVARTLAKTLNCQEPPQRAASGVAVDCCDRCRACRKIETEIHEDVQWVRPESKLRVVTIQQMRELMQTVHLKPTEAAYKVAVIVAADRLNEAAANAFLKTLEEPPPRSVLILLTTEPQRVLETVRSRCLRLNLGEGAGAPPAAAQAGWLAAFAHQTAQAQEGLLGRYRLLGVLLAELARRKAQIETDITARSPLEVYEDADPKLREKWEAELAAAIEAEYRRQRAEVLGALQWWLRDLWLAAQRLGREHFSFADLAEATEAVARRTGPSQALGNLEALERTQRVLYSNVQEALALEVGLLKLSL